MSQISSFDLVYGRAPTQNEQKHLTDVGIDFNDLSVSNVRRTIGCFDRQNQPSAYIVRFSAEDVRYVSFEGFDLAIDIADDSVGRAILFTGAYEPHMSATFRRLVKKGMSVVDVGANIGYFTFLFASLVGPEGRVTSFEPNSENCRLILLSKERNAISNLTLFPIALSNKTGVAFFSAHVGTNGGLLPNNTHVLSNAQCTVVPTFRLDDLVTDHIDLLKIDIEGAEAIALEGGWNVVKRYRPIVSSEFSPEMLKRVSGIESIEFIRRFTDIGYSVYHIERDNFSGEGTRITDIKDFINNYGAITRIEDLIFFP